MKTTAFTRFHVEEGAKMVPFAGFSMPVEFTGIIDEHNTVREKAGVFDVSHMGEIFISGPDATDFLQFITSNDVSSLVDGKVQYSCLPNGHGGIIDDVLVYRYNAQKYLMVVNSSNTEKDWNWCLKHAEAFGLKQGTDIVNASDSIAQLAVQGPLALKAMQKLTIVPVEDMEYYTFKELEFAGIKDVLFSTTGYTGSGGCEIYVKNEDGPALWKAVFDAGREYGIKPIGLGARDTLRLEMGYCLYGNDINDETSPIEAGLGWITKFNKNFIDKEFLLNQKKNGVSRKLRGFIMDEKAIPRQHYEVFDRTGKKIGEVTSGTMAPVLKQGIGMAYLGEGFWNAGTEIYIRIRNKDVRAHVVEMPFYKKQL